VRVPGQNGKLIRAQAGKNPLNMEAAMFEIDDKFSEVIIEKTVEAR